MFNRLLSRTIRSPATFNVSRRFATEAINQAPIHIPFFQKGIVQGMGIGIGGTGTVICGYDKNDSTFCGYPNPFVTKDLPKATTVTTAQPGKQTQNLFLLLTVVKSFFLTLFFSFFDLT